MCSGEGSGEEEEDFWEERIHSRDSESSLNDVAFLRILH